MYDYGDNINEKYNGNKSYPGFQQDNGSTNVGTAFSKWASFNFGNNITSDLAAGQADVTVKDGMGINATTNGANSPISDAMNPKLGTDGYPALSDGMSLRYLFSNNRYATKKNTASINGLFQYHENTGAYTFNSRENHAQFDPSNDTFTLYKQLITSNFMMYPFGNFLPFNDIVHQCAQVSTIDKAYLTQIAGSAQKKSTDNSDAYNTLSTQLTKFIGLMDNAHTWDVDVFKYTMNGETEKALAGATFTLSKNADGSNPIARVSEGNNVYRVAKTGETGTVTEITTDATGKFTIKGLDADTYYLTETAAPAGYNKLAGPVTIVIGENGVVNGTTEAPQGVDEVKVLNQSGTELPSTGGMGTTIFYVLGGVLVLVAVVLLVTKKRMNKKG